MQVVHISVLLGNLIFNLLFVFCQTIYASQLEMIEGAGHMVMVEQPLKVNELIHTFILKDMTIFRALQASRKTSSQAEGALESAPGLRHHHPPSPVHRHKTVPNISIT